MPYPSPTLNPPFQPGPQDVSAAPLPWGVPSAARIRSWTTDGAGNPTFPWDRFGYPAPTSGSDRLDGFVAQAVAYVELITGRKLDDTLSLELQPIAQDAVVMRTEQLLTSRTGKRARTSAGEGLGLKSMRAGDYSETRFDPDQARKARMINSWQELNDMLFLLATPERRAQLLADLSDDPPPVGLTVPMTVHGFGHYGSPYGYWP